MEGACSRSSRWPWRAYRRTDHRVFESAALRQGMRGVYQIGASVLVPPALGGSWSSP